MFYLTCFCYFRQLTLHSGSKSACAKFSTGGNDGKIIVWDVRVSYNFKTKSTVVCLILSAKALEQGLHLIMLLTEAQLGTRYYDGLVNAENDLTKRLACVVRI